MSMAAALLGHAPNRPPPRSHPTSAPSTQQSTIPATPQPIAAIVQPGGVEVCSGTHGLSLHSTRSAPRATIIAQESPLALVPPFHPSLGAWSTVETLVTRLGFTDDALVLYRGIVLAYMFDWPSSTAKDVKQKLLALYDPILEPKQRSKRETLLKALLTAVKNEGGLKALLGLFAIVAAQIAHTMALPVAKVDADDARFTSEVWLKELLALSFIYNSNNIDGVFTPAGCESSVTVVYDQLSRCNHSCVSNCVHYIEQEEAYKTGKFNAGQGIKGLTPARFDALRSSASSTAPFLRSLHSLRDITEGEDLSISYLSSQLLIQSTAKRQALLRSGWTFTCTCKRCASVDQARWLICPVCKAAPLGIEHIQSASSNVEGDLPFAFVQTCSCSLSSEISSQLLSDESTIESAFLELRANAGSARDPLALCAAFGVSMKLKQVLSDQHWIRYEYHQLMGDLYSYLGKKLDKMDAQKLQIWYLERALKLDPPSHSTLKLADITYDQSSLLIDVASARFIAPSDRVRSLYACTELADVYVSYGEQCWELHTAQSGDLAILLIHRAIYFTACAVDVYRICGPGNASAEHALQQRIGIAKLKQIDISRIIPSEITPPTSPAAPSTNPSSSNSSSSSSAIPCQSPSCPLAGVSQRALMLASTTAASLICTRCRNARYCSPACQKADWKTHKPHCKPPTEV